MASKKQKDKKNVRKIEKRIAKDINFIIEKFRKARKKGKLN